MKTFSTLFAALLVLAFTQNTNAQTYVNHAATGNNDGTSWTDAYTELATALDNYSPGDEIWVATGTYLPGTTDTSAFHLTANIQLYGGFAGTENSIDDRIIEDNPTILSGDLNGDDIVDDFETNREDNATHIMVIEGTVTTATIIDGFIFEGGHADDGTLPDSFGQFGGGVWSFGAPHLNHCTFQQNYANFSGALFFRYELSAGGKVTNCIFENNRCAEGGAGLAASFVFGDIDVEACQFTNNHAGVLGGGLAMANTNGAITNCSFKDNSSNLAGGAVFLNRTVADTEEMSNTIQNCTFENNESSNAGGLGFQTLAGDPTYRVLNCTFQGNSVSELQPGQLTGGGALFFNNFSENITALVDSCHFENNDSRNLGGATVFYDYEQGAGNLLDIRNSSFHSNTSLYGGGIQTQAEGINQEVRLLNCEFLNNEAEFFGGGYRTESEDINLQIAVDDCVFEGNQAVVDAGGFEVAQLEQATTNLTINNTEFLSNTSGNQGAGVNFYTQDNGAATININHSLFDGNSNDASGNPEEGAGGFSLNNFGLGTVDLNVESSIFRNNTSEDGAGAMQLLSFSDGEANLNNCLVVNNSGDAYGGGIGLFGEIHLTLTGNTIADNNGGGIVHEVGTLDLQNNILYNPSSDDFISSSPEDVKSLGGNLISDASFDAILNSSDQSSTDPLFEAGTFQLSQNSPAVDAGTLPDNPTATDLAGNDRIQGSCIDIGAYESPHDAGTACLTTDSREVLADPTTMFIYPNPVSATASISLENEWNGELNLRIVNALGQVVFENDFEKFDRTAVLEFDASDLPEGMYRVLISDGETMVVSSFVKI